MRSLAQLVATAVAFGALGVEAQTPPTNFTPNPNIGGGGSQYVDSPRFRVYGGTAAQADAATKALESAYTCFIDTLGWRSVGLSTNNMNSTNGPWYKMNVYVVSTLADAAAQTWWDMGNGLSSLHVVNTYMTDPTVTVHEFGHAITYSENWWINQTRTGAWWETIGNWAADTYVTSPLCQNARTKYNQPDRASILDAKKVIGDSYQTLVDGTSGTGNYYEAWPFLSFMVYNPDSYTGLGIGIIQQMIRQYKRNSNETPLHVLERLAAPTKVQTIVGRYWARMAYVDIGHPKAQQAWQSVRSQINYANLDSTGTGTYRVKSARQPRYMGANIIPLKNPSGAVSATVASSAAFTATLVVRATNGTVRYTDLVNGSGQVTVSSGEEASLVVANTPATLLLYDAFSLTADVKRGLDYTVKLTGATA